MKTRLVWITPDAQQVIGDCARVTSPQNQGKDPSRLLRYCIRHGHWSPFEMASMCIEIETTRAISAQILRHRSFSFQEFSQRYASVQVQPVMPEMRLSGATNRQSSISAELNNGQRAAIQRAGNLMFHLYQAYREMLDCGIAAECARAVLPMCSPTRLYMAGTIRSWIHYTDLRKKSDTQEEHREIAQNILSIMREQLPVVMTSLEEGTTE